jgi:hypothetical protein
MNGRNTLKINQATMIEAVQYWAASQFKEAITVTGVTKDSSEYGDAESFVIQLSSKDAATDSPQ